jgi:hypothetical protein
MIDKSLSYKYRAENRKGFFRGAQADTRSGQSMSPGTSASGGSRNGGASHDRGGGQHQQAAKRSAPVTTAKAPPSILSRETKPAHLGDTGGSLPKPKIDTGPKIDVGFQEELRKQKIKEEILNDPKVDEGFKRYIRQPETFETPDRKGIFSNFDAKEMAENQAKKMVKNKIMSELGIAKLNLPFAIGSWLLGKFAPDKKAALTKKLKSTIEPAFDKDSLLGTPDWQGEKKRTKTFHEGEGGDKQQVSTVEEAISGKKALGIDLDELRKKQFIMKNALDEGYYTDNKGRIIQLTDEQKSMLKNYVTRIDQYLVDPRAMSAYGGRIDKALGGRSRDI